MQIFIAADHRGYSLKNRLVTDLPNLSVAEGESISIIDLGPNQYVESDDFNDAAINVCKAILNTDKAYGIIICGSAIGVSIQANRFKHIRAAVVNDIETAEISRLHNDSNVICLSADRLATATDPLETEKAYEDIIEIIRKFLSTPFSGEERYLRRIKRLDKEI